MDFKSNPGFVHRLMGFVTDAILTYNRQALNLGNAMNDTEGTSGTTVMDDYISPWAFHRGGVRMGLLGSDEVSCDMFCPADYEEFIFPYECKAATIYDKVYYHSCGNLTPLFDKIMQIPHLHRLHVSPWSDMATATKSAAGRAIIEKHLAPTIRLDSLNIDEMRAYVRQVTGQGVEYPLDMVIPTETRGGRLYRKILDEERGESRK